MKKIYWTYRRIHIIWQAWLFWPAEFLNKQYEDYAWLTSINDTPIENIKYSKEITPWIIKLKRLIIWEYDENIISELDFMNNIKNVWAQYQIEIFDNLENTKQWIRDNTNLIEIEDWKFENWEYYEDIKWTRDIEIEKIRYNEETEEEIKEKEIIQEEYTIESILKTNYLIIW